MEFVATYHTDVGLTKKTNQDSLALKIVEICNEKVAFGVVCDGMGGLSKGELASKEVIYAFCDWFDNILLKDIEKGIFDENRLVLQWNDVVQSQNQKLGLYGKKNNLTLGTTTSAILLFRDMYYIVHVGDSRIYRMDNTVTMLTHDQTFVAREIAAGRMTEEQAKTDSRRSVLLQCIGASPIVEPEFSKGELKKDTVYVLCSDGFRHQISDDEMIEKLGPAVVNNQESMKVGCIYLTELVKERKETDNISVAVIKAM